MYLMQTVSAVPRSKTTPHMETRSSYFDFAPSEIHKYNVHSFENGMVNHPRLIYESRANDANEIYVNRKQQEQNEIISHNVGNNQSLLEDEIEIENDDEKNKKKDKKWSFGGFFRRKCKKDADDSSEESGNESKRGFLSRRKSKRERRKVKARSIANGFDVVIPQQKDSVITNGMDKTSEQLWGGTTKVMATKTSENVTVNGPVRFIHRHHNTLCGSEASRSNKDCLQVPKQFRRDSNLSRSSGGSDNIEGRKGRKEVLARAEAKRDLMRENSSSDEYESYHSNSSLNRLNGDPSHREGPRRLRRAERHSKRLSKADDNQMNPRDGDIRMIKSDLEGQRNPPHSRWISRNYYPDSSDHEAVKFNLINSSDTPSPTRSPRVRPKKLLQYMPLAQSSYPTSTFPPGIHYQQSQNTAPNHSPFSRTRKNAYAKENLHGSQPFVNVPYRNQSYRSNRSSEYIHNMPRSLGATDGSANRRSLMNYEQFLSSCEPTKGKSLSYDQDIHRACYFDNEPSVGALSANKTNFNRVQMESRGDQPTSRKQNVSEIFSNNVRRSEMSSFISSQQTSRSYGNENGLVENRTDSTPSLSIPSGNFPHHPTQIIQKSASGNSFCNYYENSNNVIQNRSNSYQHIPTYMNQSLGHHYGHFLGERPPMDIQRRNPVNTQSGKPNGVSLINWSQSDTSQPTSPGTPDATKDSIYSNVPLALNKPPQKDQVSVHVELKSSPSILRYYADQNPRSRNPIHITCNPASSSHNVTSEHPYLSDSQVIVKPVKSRSGVNASEFWKQKDQELMIKNSQVKKSENFLKPVRVQSSTKLDRSRSSSPRRKEGAEHSVIPSQEISSCEVRRAINGNVNQAEYFSRIEDKSENAGNRMVSKEEFSVAKINKTPPEPPIRRLSKQEVLARLLKCEQLQNEESKNFKNDKKFHNSNLDDALNELEVIYNSLSLKDEDLAERADRRDLPVYRPNYNLKEYNSISVRDKIQNFYAETEFSQNHLPRLQNSPDGNITTPGHQRALPLRRSKIPDKVSDDMAFRRMNSKERADIKKLPSQSYLRSSPALSPLPGGSPILRKESPVVEPDVTYDDVVFRNIRHANSTLKIQDPQPPFGIPIGVIAPAPNSDYLHAMPKERFRPTFTSSKTPDVVKDDLAFRNLRKDNKMGVSPLTETGKSDSNGLLKKRAVRSLSANLYNIMQKENPGLPNMETNNNIVADKDNEKTQSLTDLSNGMWAGKQALEKKLKELKEEKNAKRAEFFDLSEGWRKRAMKKGENNLSWEELVNPNGDFESMAEKTTSSETLTECSKGSNDPLSKHKIGFPSMDHLGRSSQTPEKNPFRSPVVELSKYPAAAPSSTIQGNPFKDASLGNSVDEDQLENLLSALVVEAKNASKDLERQLDQLEAKKLSKANNIEEKSKAIEEFNKKFKTNSSDKNKRRRNLSLSNSYEPKEEVRKTGSLERKREKKQNSDASVRKGDMFQFKEFFQKDGTANQGKQFLKERQQNVVANPAFGEFSENHLLTEVPLFAEIMEDRCRGEGKGFKVDIVQSVNASDTLSCKEQRRSLSFDVITDLSQILQDVEVEQHLNIETSADEALKKKEIFEGKDVFQEVYEYNCRLTSTERKRSQGNDDALDVFVKEVPDEKSSDEVGTILSPEVEDTNVLKMEDVTSDIEEEFERLHEEVNSNPINAKECHGSDEFTLVDDLLADITSVDQSPSSSYSSFPFPKDENGASGSSNERSFKSRDGSSPGSSKGEEYPQNSNDSLTENCKSNTVGIKEAEVLIEMFSTQNKEKETTPPNAKGIPTSNSSSENDRKRERIENYKDARRRELSTKYGSRYDTTTKSFKSTRKKEDLRGGGMCDMLLSSYFNNQCPENQVPLSDSRRCLPRRDGNKTDSASGNNEETSLQEAGSATSTKECILVRETRASRLRAASRTSDSGSPSSKPSQDVKKSEKDKISFSGTPTYGSLTRKNIDKSHTRKSHLNRSHTSEGVYDDIYVSGDSNVRRRRGKNLSLESSPVKSDCEKCSSLLKTMGNSNGSLKETMTASERTPRAPPQLPRSPLNARKKSPNLSDRFSLKTNGSEEKKGGDVTKGDSDFSRESLTHNKAQCKTQTKASPEHKIRSAQTRLSSVENIPPRKSSEQSKSVDIAARAEILAASTLKMINRLDEINNKSKRTQVDTTKAHLEEASNKALPFNTVISNICKPNKVSESNAIIHKTEAKKVSASDESTLKCSSVPNCKNIRLKTDATNKSSFVNMKPVKSETTKTEAKVKGDIVNKPSILKNKSPGSRFPNADTEKPKPVSILKRKSLSQDETQSSSFLVTFSPSVLKRESNGKRQGILKKRRSLDENEVQRRRSYSPDANYSDFKSILKNQRRSSLEELTRRSHSPDSTPQGILKRKSSKEEEIEEPFGNEPQGILKRKSSPCLSTSHQVNTTESVVFAMVTGIGDLHVSENVRPILKKKSSSEEYSASDISLTEVPKSILKKKTSLDMDEGDEKPKKPILKSSRMSSLEEPEDGKRCKGLTFNADAESVKPILKRENSQSKVFDGNVTPENDVVLRRVKTKTLDRPYSSSDIDNELNAIFLKRRSLELQPFSAKSLDWDLRKPRIASSNERLRGDAFNGPLSVTEKINNLENFLEVERVMRERRNSPPGTPPDLKSLAFSPFTISSTKNASMLTAAGDLARPRSEELPTTTTQENEELQSSTGLTFTYDTRSESPDHRVLIDDEVLGDIPSFTTVLSCQRTSESDDGEFNFPSNINTRKSSFESINDFESAKETNQLFSRSSFHSTESEQIFTAPSSNKSDDSRYDTDCLLSVDSCGEKISSLSLKDSSFGSCTDIMDEKDLQDLIRLQKSGSVSAKSSLFKELENKFKEDEKDSRKLLKGSNTGIKRRNEKKFLQSNAQRFHTQPVSTEEVVAARKNRSTADDKTSDEVENYEDELSSMSYKDRLRLFELSFSPQTPESISKKRGARFRTQPVTSVEVETAQNQRQLPSAVSSVTSSKQNNQDMCGLNPLSSKTRKEQFHNRTNNDLISKPSNVNEERNKPKGILKNFNQFEEIFKKSSSDSESSDSEKKSYVKRDPSESFRSPKKVLGNEDKESNTELKSILKHYEKKLASSGEEDSTVDRDASGKQENSSIKANLATLLQKVEQVTIDSTRKPEKEDSDGNDISLKYREVGKHIQNEGIARRLNAKARNSSVVVKSQSHTSVSSSFRDSLKSTNLSTDRYRDINGKTELKDAISKVTGESSKAKDEPDQCFNLRLGGLQRSTTQPVMSSEGSTDDDMSGATIQERLARLRRRGELDWQKRKSHVTNLEDELSVITAGNYLFNETCLLKDENRVPPPPSSNLEEGDESKSFSSILADRLGKLDAAKDGWKKRIKPSDAVKFSVEGKMSGKSESLSPPSVTMQISPTRTPVAERKKRSPKAIRFRSKQCNLSLSSVPSSPIEKINNPIARSISAPGTGKDGLCSLSAATVEECNKANVPVVTVPKIDDETFTSFFNGICTEKVFQERLDIRDEDLDVVTRIKSSQLLVQKRDIKIQRRRTTVKNPVKALAARLSSQEYTEIKTGVAEKELKRMKIEKAVKNSNLAIEALAGLASQEDFTAINLKKASDGGISSPDAPYKDLMLLHIKGRRHVQTRLIEPIAQNINAGDCYLLITPNRVFHYVGKFSNVIEKSRGAEISLHIQQKGDLGCTASSVITIGEGGRANTEQIKEFWQLLGGDSTCEREAGNVDEDELFESALVDTNMVYEVVNDELVPIETYWGSIPKMEILDPNKILVFDFGSEFYVWNGKNVNLIQRKVAVKLAKELWEEGFDYTDCDVCPLTAATYLGNHETEITESEKAGAVRPGWTLFAKITQNMETVLFREKFLDWPDYSRVIRKTKKNEESDQGDSNATIDLKPCDAKNMLENLVPEPDLVLEGNHLGRGTAYFDEETRRCSEITSRDVTVWHIREFDYSEISSSSVGQFHMEDSYVVRWHYVITITGRELGGQPSKHLTTGRDRYAYFFWQGQDSPINDKGAAACLTMELDKEHGPQVRVVQGFEPPAFLNLFQGKMVVHKGRRSSGVPCAKWRFFIVRGETETESVLYEVPCSMRHLRSVASFVLVNRETGKIIVWHGWKALEHTRKIALSAAKHIKEQPPDDFEFHSNEISIREEIEGSESHDFIKAVGGGNRQLYYSLLEDKSLEVKTPRLFHLTSVSGEFLFSEMTSPHLLKSHTTPFPFLQSDLFSVSQPALFLLDTGSCLWLWQGWWEENSENDRGSGNIRFQAERRAAMSTALMYWTLKYGNGSPKAYLIWAGLEPLIFTNQFPFWNDRDDIAEINMRDGKKPGEAVLIKTELASLTQSTYPLAQLQNRPLPDGVNPTSLEDYLEPQCFLELFGVEKEEFIKMPSWKKKKLKQEAGLF